MKLRVLQRYTYVVDEFGETCCSGVEDALQYFDAERGMWLDVPIYIERKLADNMEPRPDEVFIAED